MTEYNPAFVRTAANKAGYLDLRAHPDGSQPAPMGLFSDDPYATQRRVLFHDAELGVAVGWLAACTGDALQVHPFDEFLLVEEGELAIETAAGTERLAAGEAAEIPKGLSCRLGEGAPRGGDTRLAGGWGGRGPKPRRTAGDGRGGHQKPGRPLTAELPTTPAPTVEGRADYADASGQFRAGVWRAAAYRRRPVESRQHELMKIVEGHAELDSPAVGLQRFEVGDIFLTARGADYALGSDTTFRKIFCCFRPSA